VKRSWFGVIIYAIGIAMVVRAFTDVDELEHGPLPAIVALFVGWEVIDQRWVRPMAPPRLWNTRTVPLFAIVFALASNATLMYAGAGIFIVGLGIIRATIGLSARPGV
jgi:hypothetical protein